MPPSVVPVLDWPVIAMFPPPLAVMLSGPVVQASTPTALFDCEAAALLTMPERVIASPEVSPELIVVVNPPLWFRYSA